MSEHNELRLFKQKTMYLDSRKERLARDQGTTLTNMPMSKQPTGLFEGSFLIVEKVNGDRLSKTKGGHI